LFSQASWTRKQDDREQVEHWVLQERCQVVRVLGMGGIGKSALAVTFMHQVAPAFQAVVFRSLRDAPPCQDLLAEQYARLSTLEQALLTWLVVVCEPLRVAELQALLVPPVADVQVSETIPLALLCHEHFLRDSEQPIHYLALVSEQVRL
jgi:hypothetical protein